MWATVGTSMIGCSRRELSLWLFGRGSAVVAFTGRPRVTSKHVDGSSHNEDGTEETEDSSEENGREEVRGEKSDHEDNEKRSNESATSKIERGLSEASAVAVDGRVVSPVSVEFAL